MPITVIYRQQRHEVIAPSTVGAALSVLSLPPEMYLVVRDGVLLNGEDILQEGETIQLIGVISGG